MRRIGYVALAALTCLTAFVGAPASAATIANPTNSYGSPYMVRGGSAGLFDFALSEVHLTQGQTYVAFLSTYGLADNAGLATVGSCLPFAGCNSNASPNLGSLVTGNVLGDRMVFNSLGYLDATFGA